MVLLPIVLVVVLAAIALFVITRLPLPARLWTLALLVVLEAGAIVVLIMASIPDALRSGYEHERLQGYLQDLARCAAVPRLRDLGASSLQQLTLDLDRGKSVNDAVSAQRRSLHEAIDQALKQPRPSP